MSFIKKSVNNSVAAIGLGGLVICIPFALVAGKVMSVFVGGLDSMYRWSSGKKPVDFGFRAE